MRLIIVSNRLPVTVSVDRGEISFNPSAGGLATGLSTFLENNRSARNMESLWVGWPGATVDQSLQKRIQERAMSEYKAYAVFLEREKMDNFYHGFCNKTIWALFHYFPSFAVYNEQYWQNYVKVNRIFCDVVQEIRRPGDVIWIHDYHLMLLPKMLREQDREVPIGFFLHIPFPTYEVFRLLPSKWRSEILHGILGADVVGFHTHDDVQYFLRCAQRIAGLENNMGQIYLKNRFVTVDSFPMGIDYERFLQRTQSDEVAQEREHVKKILRDFRVILSIDRLDYSKGIVNRLQAYELFLEKNPDWRGKVVLVLIVVPSRIGVEHYQRMKREIDEQVGRINGRFAQIRWTPILYQYRSLSNKRLLALYSSSDVMLVTPLRDGMNLIAKEYIACRPDKTGVLILSEMAGASKELSEAIIINPNSIEEIISALKDALNMPVAEQTRRNESMQNRLRRYNITRWANDFLHSLENMKREQSLFDARFVGGEIQQSMVRNFANSRRRLLILDYDGTLVPFAPQPQLAAPDADLMQILRPISELSDTDVVILSGRDRHTLQNWFGGLCATLVAEHGIWLRDPNHDWSVLIPAPSDWKQHIIPVVERFADRLPGAFVEEKEFGLAFHYRESDADLAAIRVKELGDNLMHLTANMDLQILHGNKVIEVRNSGINKGAAALHFLGRRQYDFVFAAGDDWTDEDLFGAVPFSAYSIKVGFTASRARYNVRTHHEIREILREFSAIPD